MLRHILKWINRQERIKGRDAGDTPTCPACGSTKIQYSNGHRVYFCQDCWTILGEKLVGDLFIKTKSLGVGGIAQITPATKIAFLHISTQKRIPLNLERYVVEALELDLEKYAKKTLEEHIKFNLDPKIYPNILTRKINTSNNKVYLTSFSGKKWALQLYTDPELHKIKKLRIHYAKNAKLYFSTICGVVPQIKKTRHLPKIEQKLRKRPSIKDIKQIIQEKEYFEKIEKMKCMKQKWIVRHRLKTTEEILMDESIGGLLKTYHPSDVYYLILLEQKNQITPEFLIHAPSVFIINGTGEYIDLDRVSLLTKKV